MPGTSLSAPRRLWCGRSQTICMRPAMLAGIGVGCCRWVLPASCLQLCAYASYKDTIEQAGTVPPHVTTTARGHKETPTPRRYHTRARMRRPGPTRLCRECRRWHTSDHLSTVYVPARPLWSFWNTTRRSRSDQIFAILINVSPANPDPKRT